MILNDKLNLLNLTGITVIASRPGMGKTTLAIDIARQCVLDEKRPIAFFSLETSQEKIIEKLNVPLDKVFIDDTAVIQVSEIHRKCREQNESAGLKLVIIDYFQLITGATAEEKAGALKEMSLDLGVPVFVTSQISSKCKSSRPSLETACGDVKVLADIADNVIFLYCEEATGEHKLSFAKRQGG